MRKLTVILILLYQTLSAQNLDSLKRNLVETKNDTVIVNIYNEIGNIYMNDNVDSCIRYYNLMKDYCEKNLKRTDNKKLHYFYTRQLATAYSDIGLVKSYKGDIAGALDFYSKSLKLSEKINEKIGISSVLSNIGVVYYGQNEFDKAEEYFLKARSIALEVKDTLGLSSNTNFLCYIYSNRDEHEKALEQLKFGLKLLEGKKWLNNLGYIYNDMGVVYTNMNNMNKAIECYKKSIDIRREIGDKQGLSNSYQIIGSIYLNQKQYKNAEDYLLRSLDLAKELEYPDNIKRSSVLLKKLYKSTGKYDKALSMYELYITMRDSLNNQNTRKATIRSQLKYEYEKKSAADSVAHANETKIKNVMLSKQYAEIRAKRGQQYALFGGLVLIGVFSILMFNRFRVTQKQKTTIEIQKSVVEEQKILVEAKQKELLDSIEYAQRIQKAQLPTIQYIDKFLSRKRI